MRILSTLKNILRNKSSYFLDTNILIKREKRKKNPPISFFEYLNGLKTTEATFNELVEKRNGGALLRQILFDRLNVVNFNDLYQKSVAICPVYYTLISSIYNPANICSEFFIIQLIQSMKFAEKKLEKTHTQLYQQLMDELAQFAKNAKEDTGLSLLDKNINISTYKFYKKRISKKQRNSPAAFNDYRSFITAFLYSVINKQNVIFVTADRDFFTIHRNLIESIAQESVFKSMILEKLTDVEKDKLLSGKGRVTKYLSYKQFKENVDNFIQDMISCDWQKEFTTFSIRFWDYEKEQYAKDLVLYIDTTLNEIILNTHSNLSCYSAKNDTYSNWLGYYYWPPSQHNEDTIKLVIYAKKIKNIQQLPFSPIEHNRVCKYVAGDYFNRMNEATRFWH